MDIDQFKESLERQFRSTINTAFEKIPSKYKHMIFVSTLMTVALTFDDALELSSSPFEFIFLYMPIFAALGVLLGSSVALLMWLGRYLHIWSAPAVDGLRPHLKWLRIPIAVLAISVILALIGAYFLIG